MGIKSLGNDQTTKELDAILVRVKRTLGHVYVGKEYTSNQLRTDLKAILDRERKFEEGQ